MTARRNCAASMTLPPRQRSPSHSTADWPGVTAHCGASKSSAKRLCAVTEVSRVIGLTTLGHFFGNRPWAKANMSMIIWVMITVPGMIALPGARRARRWGIEPVA
jgi:hypothetical protein